MSKKMICVIALLVLFFLSLPVSAQAASPLKINITVTWDLSLRVGIDYRPWDHVGFVADIGSTLFSFEGAFALTWDAFVVLHAFPPESRFQLSACLGIPTSMVVFTKPVAAQIPFGASAQAAYWFTDKLGGFVRIGGGVPFFLEDGTFAYRDIDFPLGLWPDVALGLKIPL